MTAIRILVTTEFDGLSANATKFAVGLPNQQKVSEIILLNVIIPAKVQSWFTTTEATAFSTHKVNFYNTELLRKHQLLVNQEAKRFSADRVSIKPIVRFSDNKTDLKCIIKSLDAGLLVFGSRDKRSFLSQIFNSEADQLIRELDCPAIILSNDSYSNPIKNIAVALDAKEENHKGLERIAEFALSLQARMDLVYVETDGKMQSESTIEQIRKIATEYKLTNYTISVVHSRKLDEGIKRFIKSKHSDMIAVLSQGKGKIKKLIFGNSAQDTINEADIPVFITAIK